MNWGTKVVLGMITFMLFIVCMVVYMFHVHGRDALIEEDYYEKGINYNVEYNAKRNVLNDNAQPKITVTKTQIVIELKKAAKYELNLMRPSNSLDDVKLKGNTAGEANFILVDKSKMAKGMWFLNLQWRSGNRNYLYKKNINL
ncbi:FixH family protein [Pedobacter jejuensis]|uniref:Nitrogen fixation protein FixH n=1 Tax=Pedobacter jejuensis TaxID=1268550 RepID=A0A3N0C1D4_9SPHI|nr:FixH family protein [Pedobacter jejuensis]RNL56063.1 nitrogen fixation protein FixH [Pedobacter jejuensis]